MRTKNSTIFLSDLQRSTLKIDDVKRVYLENTTIEVTSKNLKKSYIDYADAEKAKFEYSHILRVLKKYNRDEIYV